MQTILATSPHVRHPVVLANDFRASRDAMYRFVPVGLLSLIAAARQRHPAPILFDTNDQVRTGSVELDSSFHTAMAQRIVSLRPDVLGFMTDCDSYHHVLRICAEVKRSLNGCTVVLGGPHASAVASQTMARYPFIDAVVRGEGEVSFPRLLDEVAAKTDAPVPGVLRRRRPIGLVDGGEVDQLKSLDDLPFPAYELYQPLEGEEVFLEVGRGCPFACEFCSTAAFWKRRHRVKSAARIVAEIRMVRDFYGARRVHFTHDLFTVDRSWVLGVCEALRAASLGVAWTCSARTDTVDTEVLRAMATAGCSAIYYGLESGSERMLRAMRKSIPVDHSLSIVRQTRELGITPNVGFIVGYPGEDDRSVEDTFVAFTNAIGAGARPAHLFAHCPFAQSPGYSGLGVLEPYGHFVDVPLPDPLTAELREEVASAPDVFGALHRVKHPELPSRIICGIDEFSTLVESALQPALALARRTARGLYGVYLRWLPWIEDRTNAHGAPAWRRWYGSPLDFADFLVAELRGASRLTETIMACALVARESAFVSKRSHTSLVGSTFADYRTISLPPKEVSVGFGGRLAQGDVLSHLALSVDVGPALIAPPTQDPPDCVKRPTYLVWVEASPGCVRLLEVDVAIYHALSRGAEQPCSVAQLVAELASKGVPNFQVALDSFEAGVRLGLLREVRDAGS